MDVVVANNGAFMQEAANIIRSHEEHFDGTGYPRGLKGEEIPLGARIIAVAVSLDNITSEHVGRPAQSVQAARDEIAIVAQDASSIPK